MTEALGHSRTLLYYEEIDISGLRVCRLDAWLLIDGRLLSQVAGASNPLNDEIERENVVAGVAHLCFSDDGTWFQVRVPLLTRTFYRDQFQKTKYS